MSTFDRVRLPVPLSRTVLRTTLFLALSGTAFAAESPPADAPSEPSDATEDTAAESPAEPTRKQARKERRIERRQRRQRRIKPDAKTAEPKAPTPPPEVPEVNEDEWSPESAQHMVAPRTKAKKKQEVASKTTTPPDPQHFDQIDTSTFDIPIALNDEVRKWVIWFTGPGRGVYAKWLSRAHRYQPMMKRTLKEAGLPTDLVYLSMIESGYHPGAYSRASAGGLWQFIPTTGKRFNLRQDYWVDDRFDPERALTAAIRYLSFLHKRFKSWEVAWAAYNAGEGRLGRAVRATGSSDFWVIQKKAGLAAETQRYVPKIMAAAILGHYPELYGFTPPRTDGALEYDVAHVDGAVDLQVLARCAKTDIATIKSLNPALRRYATPADGHEVRLPVGSKDRFESALAKVPPEKRITTIRYRVRKGDTLGTIAARNKTSVRAILSANKIKNANRIYPGTRLIIPRSEGASSVALASNAKSTASRSTAKAPKVHRVKRGDTLSGIASRYGLRIDDLRQWNSLKSSRILVGQQLSLSRSGSPKPGTSSTKVMTYVVKRGDTLSQIAERYGVSVTSLQKRNGIRRSSSIQVGQRLHVPVATSRWNTYKVRAGDSLGLIAQRHHCSISDLKTWNQLNSSVIHPGQALRIRK